MIVENVLRINDGSEELEIVFNPSTLETKIGKIELSKADLVRLTAFLDDAINAKNSKERKEKSVVTKILNKISQENSYKGLSVNWI